MNFNKKFPIGNLSVGADAPVLIIAEAGVNHNGDINLAKKLIDAAVEAGVDCVKFQTFKAERLNTKGAPKSSYHLRTTPSDAEQSWLELLKTQEISLNMHKELIRYCRQRGILFLSTPYDYESVDLLVSLGIPAFKVASTDTNNYPFLSYLAKTDRPIILSTAMSELEEVRKAVETVAATGNPNLALLHCTANYPCAIENTNLRAMLTLEREFGLTVGYSDHCPERINPVAAVALGAKIIEKHFTISRDLPGPDHQASLTPQELTLMVKDIRGVEAALGDGIKKPLDCELENRSKLRKSLVANCTIPIGTVITEKMLATKRPGTGTAPEDWNVYLGKAAKENLIEDQQLFPKHVE
ncbi:MAG: N-acetylneuraminate synthase [SAR324 cluster bacterium]|uniref:N-acetylneuraminate synthase n=1 Tax=SAR324 cluster bacterium TaxID=2024889 RepID=A0A2A4T2J3_9DELT|nr:MAG: N-acetylneuraminate synthase [SAR324 cluster bacterium]